MNKENIKSLIDKYNFVVPEIQREYVWGMERNRPVLNQFLKDLDAKIAKGNANIGFLYSYKSGNEHYLIDGQQRYTTIILLLYYLSSSLGKDVLSSFIESLRLSSPLQAFAYRVRSYTDSFLNNLLRSGVTDSQEIRDQIWFKREYEEDPTIKSMLGATTVFNNLLKNCPNLSLDNVLNNVYFWYFDVDRTSQGEELYITMNSRGEKLTDSEQIKPRLLRKESKKEYYGKQWDKWEDFFYDKSIRGKRDISTIDIAMNNVIRIVLELKTKREHNQIRPVDDSELINLQDIELYVNALTSLIEINSKEFVPEITRLFGDSDIDRNFYTLKALLIEKVKGQTDPYEFERVYQTVTNQVRRNKLNNLPFLVFLNSYSKSKVNWYDFILQDNDDVKAVINGHELEKIKICHEWGKDAETAIWKEQSNPFWYGDIKQLISWSQKNNNFNLQEFIRISNNFNLLFDKSESSGWTSDFVRQALLTRRLPNYPTNNTFFGFYSYQWKTIMADNSEEFLSFLNMFDGANKDMRDNVISELKKKYPETPDNPWAEFVHHDYLLDYCNTKRVQIRNEYGIECVQNSYKQPVSVKNMHLEQFLKEHIEELQEVSNGWGHWIDKGGWKSVIRIYKYGYPVEFAIQYRKDKNEQFEVELVIKETDKIDSITKAANDIGFYSIENKLIAYVQNDMNKLMIKLKNWILSFNEL